MSGVYYFRRALSKLKSWMRAKLQSKNRMVPPISAKCGEVGVLAQLHSPSIRYLIEPTLANDGKRAKEVDVGSDTAMRAGLFGCSEIIIVRYLSADWIRNLQDFKAAGGRIVYFMDDDLMDVAVTRRLPRSYQKKIYKHATRHRCILEALCDEFWVATPFLANKYYQWQPRLLSPQASVGDLTPVSNVSVCYHGTSSHSSELAWIAPVIGDVLRKVESIRFEIFGDISVNRVYRDLPRVSVLHPMSWENYLAYTRAVRNDIALAPLTNDPFNHARGPTKFFDFVRMKAVGIYSNVEPYSSFVRDGIDGILLPNDPLLWSETITELAADPIRRERMLKAAEERALSMAWGSQH